jgi:hypothetical protein
MTEKSDPLENAISERVNGVLKTELLEEAYSSFEQAKEVLLLPLAPIIIFDHITALAI